ncbi:Gfo/Idh/MocA family protein [Oenococcus kitaharae]|uniref:Oxidoreductase n=1 Tax=Oenococcus kitaharae DSM 17330 TaxID=1045004 RepID=G9WIS3_9LACO|nr:Gfo/Idh/MocA family oxidoreductase [Oenococcus kitaharae]EHN58372.1 hypothetical protein OKIT_0247 [Oenococcus kitaharae DSM 17330]OEY81463.1 hypothetical protein NT95_08105 [Oenococcus kitaharae]OEY82951.1 hypothetical protein NV75_06205 [Oenococcus kitaharae]OEY84505.1 hypothetical protein NT96_04430 [Oenococcus kitaharae]
MNVGIIGSGLITQAALDIFSRLENVQCTAMYFRSVDQTSAALIQKKYKINTIYDNIDDFLSDTSFNVVYIGVINSAHYGFAKKALLANKQVISEKAFTSTYKEAADLAKTAEDHQRLLFGANRLTYTENFKEIQRRMPQLGDIKLVMCNYSQYSRRYNEYLKRHVLPVFDPTLSGGSLYDINVYNVYFVVALFGEPQSVHYYPNKGFNGIDTSGILVLTYKGFQAVCSAAKDSESSPFMTVQGTKGHIDVESIPSQVENVSLTQIGQPTQTINLNHYDDAMENEFIQIFKIINEKNDTLAAANLNVTLNVMKVLETARQDAGIRFTADDQD